MLCLGSSKDGRNSGDPDENDDLHVYIEGKLLMEPPYLIHHSRILLKPIHLRCIFLLFLSISLCLYVYVCMFVSMTMYVCMQLLTLLVYYARRHGGGSTEGVQ